MDSLRTFSRLYSVHALYLPVLDEIRVSKCDYWLSGYVVKGSVQNLTLHLVSKSAGSKVLNWLLVKGTCSKVLNQYFLKSRTRSELLKMKKHQISKTCTALKIHLLARHVVSRSRCSQKPAP